MRLLDCLLVAILAIAVPTQALLGAKLALLGALRNGFVGDSSIGGNGNGNGYGRSYGNGGYSSVVKYNRPVYTGHNTNYGWGEQSYGGGYALGYNGRYNGGSDEAVRVIKVIVTHEQPLNYARNPSVATTSGVSLTPIPAPIPVVQTYASQPIPAVRNQVTVPDSVSTPTQVIQPPRPVYLQPQPQAQPQYIQQPQPVYQEANVQRPIQYPVQQPIYQRPQSVLVYQQPQPFYSQHTQNQPTVKTIKVLVNGEAHVPAQYYGPPPPSPTYVAPSVDNAGVWNSDSWSSSNSANGWNNVGAGPWKSGSILTSIGC